MAGFSEASAAFSYQSSRAEFITAATLLGLASPGAGGLDAHDLCLAGLPGTALEHLVSAVRLLRDPAVFETALGMSIRTFQRRKDDPQSRLSAEQSGRVWVFADILAQAISVFGAQEDAEDWMLRPALGLNGRLPVELLGSPAGIGMLTDFLGRLEYGVYT